MVHFSFHRSVTTGAGRNFFFNNRAEAPQPDKQLTIDDVPEHARSVMDDETQSDLSTEQLHQVCDMMLDFPDGFMAPGAKRGETDVTEHGMDMQNKAPVKQRWKPWPRAKMEAADELVQQMLEDDVIEPSDSPWASPAVLVTMKDGTIRSVLITEKWFFFDKEGFLFSSTDWRHFKYIRGCRILLYNGLS